MIKNLTITIFESDNEDGYMYDIYHATPEEIVDGIDSVDGGCCTGSLADALEMAVSQTMTDIDDDEALEIRLARGDK